MTPEKPAAVIFDWDDTLMDTWPVALQALNASLTAMGEEAWTDAQARVRAGRSARDLFMGLFGARWEEADRYYYDTFIKLAQEGLHPHAGAEDVLRVLSGAGVYMAVVSNKRGPLLREEAARAGFDKFFGRIVGAGDAAADKPDPAPVVMALEGSGIAPGPGVWFVGDSPVDMLCARNAGCLPLLIETKPPPEEALAKALPAARFGDHYKIMEYIEICLT